MNDKENDMLNDALEHVLDDDSTNSAKSQNSDTEATSSSDSGKSLKEDLVVDISAYLNAPETFYRNYFDLEGGTYPDLFSRETTAKNDRSSTVKYLAVHRGAKIYSDLLTNVLTERMRNSKEMNGDKRVKMIKDLLQKFTPSNASINFEDNGDKTK